MKVSRRRGEVRLQLEPVEAQVLSAVLTELAHTLEADSPGDDPVRARLFPAGYRDDEAAAEEFRALTETTLRDERSARTRRCVADLYDGAQQTSGRRARGVVELALGEDDGQRWIATLNDARLALGTRLGITEDDPDDDPAASDFHERSLYHWLTAVQDSLVRALMD